MSAIVNDYHHLELSTLPVLASALIGPGEEGVVVIDDWHLLEVRSEVERLVGPLPPETSVQILSIQLRLEGEFDRGAYFYLVADKSAEAWNMSYCLTYRIMSNVTLKRWFHASDWYIWIDYERGRESGYTIRDVMEVSCRVSPKFPAKLFRFVIKAVTYRERHSALAAWSDEGA